MKKITCFIALMLTLFLTVQLLPQRVDAATSGYYTYTVSGKNATITDVNTSISGNVTIPSKLGSFFVTSIGSYAFENCIGLTRVTIPDSVTNISSGAFKNCASLASVTISDSVTSIGSFAFSGCDSLISIVIPKSVTNIANGAFSSCDSLTRVTIPDSVTSIGGQAFSNCISLTSITIPDSVTSIGSAAFSWCDSLTSITIPDSVTSIGDRAFENCNSLNGVDIPDRVTSIGDYAFSSCDSLTSVTIGDSVTSIGKWAFSNCTSLTSITISNSVTSIGEWAFSGCIGLMDVYFYGKQSQWDAITIGRGNERLTSATLCCGIMVEQADGMLLIVADGTEDSLELVVGQVLDLNGKVLTVGSLVSFGQIIDSVGGGGLIVENIEITGNDWLPIQDSTGCYRFYEYEVENLGSKETAEGAIFGFTLDFEDATAYTTLLASDDVQVTVTLTAGESTQTYAFSKELVAKYVALVEKYPDLRPYMKLNVTGLDSVEAGTVLTVTPSVTAVSGKIQNIGAPMTYTA